MNDQGLHHSAADAGQADDRIDGEREALRQAFGDEHSEPHSEPVGKPDRSNADEAPLPLPNRRPCVTHTVIHGGKRHHVTAGLHPHDLTVAEAWCYGPNVGSDHWATTQDLCRIISLDLQDGYSPEDIAAKVLRYDDMQPASLAGVIADVVLQESQTEGFDTGERVSPRKRMVRDVTKMLLKPRAAA